MNPLINERSKSFLFFLLEPAPQGMGAPKAEIPDNQREFRLQTQHYSLIPTFRITDWLGTFMPISSLKRSIWTQSCPKFEWIMKSLTQPADIIQWAQFTFLDIHSSPTNTTIPTETLSETQKTNFPIFLERRKCCQKAVCRIRAGYGWSTSKIGRSMKLRIFVLGERP